MTKKRKSENSFAVPTKRPRAHSQVREKLIQTREEILQERSELADPSSDKFQQKLITIRKISRNVDNAADSALVCEQTDMMSTILQEQTRHCDANTASVSVDDICEALRKDYMGDNDMIDLNRLYDIVHPYYRGIPPLFCFSGALASRYKKKEKKARKKRPPKAKLQVPDKLTKAKLKVDESEDPDATTRINQLMDILRNKQKEVGEHGKFRLLETVVNPGSFSESLENIYDMSHLISMGFVKVFFEAGSPSFQFLGKEGAKKAKISENRQQFCLSFDGRTHEDLSQHLSLSQIPPRESQAC